MGQKISIDSSPKKTYTWPKSTQKDAQPLIPNQNYDEVSPYTNQNGHHRKIDKQ